MRESYAPPCGLQTAVNRAVSASGPEKFPEERLLWMESMYFRQKLVWLAFLAAVSGCVHAEAAQGLSNALAAVTPKGKPAAAPADPLGRMTPRSAISNFLGACHRGGLARASQYLDLRRLGPSERAKQGPELAKTLCIVINRDAQFELNHLSTSSEGMPDDGLEPGKDLLV
ncbi:MAG: hypothetical protein ACRD4O_18215, partial [Bryobacteraceae bacterium]